MSLKMLAFAIRPTRQILNYSRPGEKKQCQNRSIVGTAKNRTSIVPPNWAAKGQEWMLAARSRTSPAAD
jgi:hypothetical protein